MHRGFERVRDHDRSLDQLFVTHLSLVGRTYRGRTGMFGLDFITIISGVLNYMFTSWAHTNTHTNIVEHQLPVSPSV